MTRRELNLLRWEFSQFIQLRLSYGKWKLKRQVANSDVGLEEKKASRRWNNFLFTPWLFAKSFLV